MTLLKFKSFFTIIILFGLIPNLFAQNCDQPHLKRVNPNLINNSGFTSTNGWYMYNDGCPNTSLISTIDSYDNDGHCLIFDKGVNKAAPEKIDANCNPCAYGTPGCNITARDKIISQAIPINLNEATNFTVGFKAKTRNTWPSPIISVLIRATNTNGASSNIFSTRYTISKEDDWQECASIFMLDETIASVQIQIFADIVVSGQHRTTYVDDVYFGVGESFDHPPACKEPFSSSQVRIDELGNIEVFESNQWYPFFPLGMMGGNYRADWSVYKDAGFNMMCRLTSAAQVEKAFDAGIYWWAMSMGFIVDDNPAAINWENWERKYREILENPTIQDQMLWYYLDNEEPSYRWWHAIETGVNWIKNLEMEYFGEQRHPFYFLNGSYGIARQYNMQYGNLDIDLCDVTGTYFPQPNNVGLVPDQNHLDGEDLRYASNWFNTLQNLDGQNIPTSIAQINSVGDNSMRSLIFTAIANGAKGMNYYRDTYPHATNNYSTAGDVTLKPWWNTFDQTARDIQQMMPLIRQPHWTYWTATHNQAMNIDFGGRSLNGEEYLIVSNVKDESYTVTFSIDDFNFTPKNIYNYFTGDLVTTWNENSNSFTIQLDPFEATVYHITDLNFHRKAEDFTQLQIFPNPAKDNINASLQTDLKNKIIKYQIMGMDGSLIQEITAYSAIKNTNINVSHLPAGSYILMAKYNQEVLATEKINVIK